MRPAGKQATSLLVSLATNVTFTCIPYRVAYCSAGGSSRRESGGVSEFSLVAVATNGSDINDRRDVDAGPLQEQQPLCDLVAEAKALEDSGGGVSYGDSATSALCSSVDCSSGDGSSYGSDSGDGSDDCSDDSGGSSRSGGSGGSGVSSVTSHTPHLAQFDGVAHVHQVLPTLCPVPRHPPTHRPTTLTVSLCVLTLRRRV